MFDKLRTMVEGYLEEALENPVAAKANHYLRKGKAAAQLLRKSVDVGVTPADAVYQHNKMTLWRYRSVSTAGEAEGGVTAQAPVQDDDRPRTPIVFVPSLINRHYILDLMPGRSLVEFLVGAGFDVYMVDWGRPSDEDRYASFDDYLDGVLHRALRRAAARAGTDKVTLIGYCMGGTLTAIYTALHPEKVRNLVTFAAPIDFSEGGLLSEWTDRRRFNADLLVDSLGNVPWQLMQASFHMLIPTLWAQKALYLYDRLENDAFVDHFLALETWGNDNVSFPGECYRRYVKDLYQGNELVRGGLYIHGKAARLENIHCPVLNVAALGDHIVPLASTKPLTDRAASTDKDLWELPGGHIGAIVSRTAARTFWPALDAWLRQRC